MTTGEALEIVFQTARTVSENSDKKNMQLDEALAIVEDLIVNEYGDEQ